VKTIFKNTFLTLCLTVYCLSVFSSAAIPSFDTKISGQHTTEDTHLAELSKIIFPQTIGLEGNGVSFVPATPDFNGEIDKAFIATKYLSQLIVQNNISSFKASKILDLQFRSEDIIFPFHYFW
jgi:hypothetical protein